MPRGSTANTTIRILLYYIVGTEHLCTLYNCYGFGKLLCLMAGLLVLALDPWHAYFRQNYSPPRPDSCAAARVDVTSRSASGIAEDEARQAVCKGKKKSWKRGTVSTQQTHDTHTYQTRRTLVKYHNTFFAPVYARVHWVIPVVLRASCRG